jgi:hypothetical protein
MNWQPTDACARQAQCPTPVGRVWRCGPVHHRICRVLERDRPEPRRIEGAHHDHLTDRDEGFCAVNHDDHGLSSLESLGNSSDGPGESGLLSLRGSPF